jgi:homoserine acetyltransferase
MKKVLLIFISIFVIGGCSNSPASNHSLIQNSYKCDNSFINFEITDSIEAQSIINEFLKIAVNY